ncbi:hypothetical protein ACHWQZ_G019105 [Mnemiopsis leidyi]
MRTVLILFSLLTIGLAAAPLLCSKTSQCGGSDCYLTCENTCGCNDTSSSPMYGGKCQEPGFCEGTFLDLQDCIEPLQYGPTCPRKMLGMYDLLESYTSYDFRIDVRSAPEWAEDHANISIPTPGLAFHPAKNYLDVLEGKEDARILVYCRSGGRAFEASHNLLKYGFSNIHSFYQGGFPDIKRRVVEVSESSEDHPIKALCYITGGSDICPTPLPKSHVNSAEDITSLGDNVVLVDVRPRSYTNTFDDDLRAPANKKRQIKKFLKTVDETEHTLVTFCEEGNFAFKGAKAMIELGWGGPIYFFDNGGYKDLKKLFA